MCENSLSKLFMIKAKHLFQYPNTTQTLMQTKLAITPNRKDWYIYSIENKKWIKIFSGDIIEDITEDIEKLIIDSAFTFKIFTELNDITLDIFYTLKNNFSRFDFNNLGFICFVPNNFDNSYANSYAKEIIFLMDSKKTFKYSTKNCAIIQEAINYDALFEPINQMTSIFYLILNISNYFNSLFKKHWILTETINLNNPTDPFTPVDQMPDRGGYDPDENISRNIS